MSKDHILYLQEMNREEFDELCTILAEKIAPVQFNEIWKRIGINSSWSASKIYTDSHRYEIRVTIKSKEFDKWKSYLMLRWS